MIEDKPKEEPKEEEKPEETVSLTKTQLDEIQESISFLKKKGEFFEAVADKREVAKWHARHKKELPVHVKLRTWKKDKEEPKVIVAWRMIRDEGAFRNLQTGKWIEQQDIEIVLEDDKKIEMPLMLWNQRYEHVDCKMVGTETDEKGNETWKVKRLDNGKEYTVGVQFLN